MNYLPGKTQWLLALLTSIAWGTGVPAAVADDQVSDGIRDKRRAIIAEKVAAAEKVEQLVLPGSDGWLYLVPELRAISAGKFWGENAQNVSRSTKPENADPLQAIVDFDQQLKSADIRLLLLPVPAKIAIYPEPLLGAAAFQRTSSVGRLDSDHQDFYALLHEHDVEVLDLVPAFLKARQEGDELLYCRTDSHWSPRAIQIAADAVMEKLADSLWIGQQTRQVYRSETARVEFVGDLARILDESNPVAESLPIIITGTFQGGRIVPAKPLRTSPVLLIGDSHTLVFHDPTLFSSGAGLPDQLARALGFPVDLVGVRGSGATTTRIELARRKDHLQGKKVVIWCLSFREFTESQTGWRNVPLMAP